MNYRLRARSSAFAACKLQLKECAMRRCQETGQ